MTSEQIDTPIPYEDGIDLDVGAIAEKVRSGELEPQQLKLLPHQVDHFHRIADQILPTKIGYLDGSLTGRGKTIVTAAISISYDIPIFVICPNTVKKVWEDICTAYNVEHEAILTYESLAGKVSSKLKNTTGKVETVLSHGYLVRTDQPKEKEKILYSPTQKLLDLIGASSRGVLFVFDECQNIKNHSTARFRACRTIAHALIRTRHNSRFAALSASPFDKEEHSLAFFRLFGILNSAQLYTKRKDTRQVYFQGIQEIIDYAETIDPVQMKVLQYTHSSALDYDNINQASSRHFIFSIYEKIIKNHIGSSIPDPNTFQGCKKMINGELFIYDGYFNVPLEDRTSLRGHIAAMHGAAELIINGVEEPIMNHLAKLTKAKKAVEMDKARLFACLVANKLNENPHYRAAIVMNHIDSIMLTAEYLKDYGVMILIGDTSVKDRNIIIDAYQRPDHQNRLVIMNKRIGGVGISLHDLYGGRDTWVFISVDFSIIDIFQIVGRFYRTGLMSDVHIYLVYGVHDGCYETSIISALAAKNKTVKGSIPGMEAIDDVTLKSKILFPGEYPVFREIDDEKPPVPAVDTGKNYAPPTGAYEGVYGPASAFGPYGENSPYGDVVPNNQPMINGEISSSDLNDDDTFNMNELLQIIADDPN